MPKQALLCERLINHSINELLESGFVFKRYLDSVQCSLCGFQTRGTLPIEHIQFMHKLSNPNCEMEQCIMYNFNNYRNAKRCIAETKKVMLLSFKSWPTLEPNFKKLVNAGFYYTGVGSKSCIECRVILNGWKCSDDPWTCLLYTSRCV